MRNYANKLEETVLNTRELNVSFEFFPPKTDEMEVKLWESISRLKNLKPSFVSVTYGAGGSTRERTHHTIKRIIEETDLKPASHLTCIAASKEEIHEILRNYWNLGVRHIVALRGDMPASSPNYQLHPHGYQHANELVACINKIADFEISVAGYPEKHPEAKSFSEDIDHLKRKVDAGASRVITQFFFDADTYFFFVERCRKAGINVPIVPGILPVTNVKQAKHFAKMCGAKIPQWMEQIFDGLDDRQETRQLVAGIVATELCRILHNEGVNDFHFYTLNRADLTTAICHVLGVRGN
ncbi:MAG: methylenetetrahydrofolate reductase [Alphaproteobacteria bacterium]|nr:methylenetetrahydrofolate reductase [Alphaproteobacteria bacterium]